MAIFGLCGFELLILEEMESGGRLPLFVGCLQVCKSFVASRLGLYTSCLVSP